MASRLGLEGLTKIPGGKRKERKGIPSLGDLSPGWVAALS